MIYIKDNFIDQELFEILNKSLINFKEVKTPGKSFWVVEPEENFVKYITSKIGVIEKCEIKNILCFFRQAKENQDDDWRIHNDSIINNQQPDRAIVLYISSDNTDELNGTAFWEHKEYGDVYKGETVEEFNNLLIKDSNDISKWNLKTVIGYRPNRLVSYPCHYFHSKYPNKFKNRKVFVMFYKTKEYERK
jgi:hypothetical protein